ncbi:MAG: hypothetical protein UIQ67_04485 [Bacteroidales bacterium]|nr:hypothetical protein [Bacteroidales bacterium]
MSRKKEVLLLAAKTGLFFANCDGEFDNKESKFISDYILEIMHAGIDIEDTMEDLIKLKGEKHTIEELIDYTKNFLKTLDEDDKCITLSEMKKFIENLINIDGVVHPNEEKYFEQWKAEFCQ